MIRGEYIDAILSGRKRATIRLGIVKPKYERVMLHGGGRPVAIVRIEKVVHKKVRELTEEDAKLDGFRSKRELLRELHRVYGKVSPEDYVTILYLTVERRISEDEVKKMPPVDLARIALRYLRNELNEAEVKILEELVRTGSLRKTAVNIYGSIEKRWKIRKILREALRRLKEKNIL